VKILRVCFFLLILANVAFLAWSLGYFDGTVEIHEPHRLAQQLNAEKMRIVDEKPVREAATACSRVSGLTQAAVEQQEEQIIARRKLEQQASGQAPEPETPPPAPPK